MVSSVSGRTGPGGGGVPGGWVNVQPVIIISVGLKGVWVEFVPEVLEAWSFFGIPLFLFSVKALCVRETMWVSLSLSLALALALSVSLYLSRALSTFAVYTFFFVGFSVNQSSKLCGAEVSLRE